MLNSLLNSNILKKAASPYPTAIPYPTLANKPNDDDEGDSTPTEEWLAWRAQFPCGHFIEKAMRENKHKIIGQGHKDMHDHESKHIADPRDYIGSKPDNEIRWKV
jgi:hypothetical protein